MDEDWLDFIKGIKKLKHKKYKQGGDIDFEIWQRETEKFSYTPDSDADTPNKPYGEYDAQDCHITMHKGCIEIDLHGYRIFDAMSMVKYIVRASYYEGHRLILFITGRSSIDKGKSYRTIKDELPRWLESEDIARYILDTWLDRKSLGGAMFVKLRRKRDR